MTASPQIIALALAATTGAGLAQSFTFADAPISMEVLQAKAIQACGGSLELGPGAVTLAEIDGDGRTDVLFDWSKVTCTGASTVGMSRGAGNCGMHMCAVDLYASSVYRPGAYPQGILALGFEVQPLGREIILRTTSMGGSCPFAQTCEHSWRWTGAELQAVR